MKRELRPHQQAAITALKLSLGSGKKLGKNLWARVADYPRYWVSDSGEVISTLREGRFLAQSLTPQGYPYVSLMRDGAAKKICTHRLVAEAFLSGGGETVNHRDGNKQNNLVENLEWCSYRENNEHARDHGLVKNFGSSHYAAKLDETKVQEIKKMVSDGLLHREVAQIFGVNRQQITKIVNNQAWRRA